MSGCDRIARTGACLLALGFSLAAAAAAGDCRTLADAERLRCFDRLVGCAGLADTKLRLACFDSRFANPQDETASLPAVDAGLGSPAADTVEPSLRARAASALAAFGFGGEAATAEIDPGKVQLIATIAEVERNRLGIDYLTLDNGQVWREIEDYRKRFREGDRVTITPGTFSSYDLYFDGSKRRIKVKRLR